MNLSGAAATIANVTLRALLGRRRTLLMLLVAGAPVLLGLIVRANGPRPESLVGALDGLIITSVLPLVALIFGTTALGSELDDGTAVHILTKPIPRWVIVVPKLVVAAGLTALMIVPSTILAGILIGDTGSHELAVTFAFALAALIGSFVYVAIFVALSVATSRGLIIGLGYALAAAIREWSPLPSSVALWSIAVSVVKTLAIDASLVKGRPRLQRSAAW